MARRKPAGLMPASARESQCVVQFCRSAVEVHIAHLLCGDAGLLHSELNGACGFLAVFLQPDTMERFASGTVSCEFAVNVHSACHSLLVALQNKHPGAFAQHKSIAVSRKRSGATLWLVVPGGG